MEERKKSYFKKDKKRVKSEYPLVRKRSEFLGRKIRSHNYKEIRNEFFDYFINVESKREEYRLWTSSQILKGAGLYSRFQIGLNKEMEKAFNKGKTHFKYKGRVHAVLVDTDPNDVVLASDLGHLSNEEE